MRANAAPVLRVRDARVAIAWWARLGFQVEFEHRFEPHLPLYVGLIAAQCVYVFLFLKELKHLVLHAWEFTEQQIMLVVLGLTGPRLCLRARHRSDRGGVRGERERGAVGTRGAARRP